MPAKTLEFFIDETWSNKKVQIACVRTRVNCAAAYGGRGFALFSPWPPLPAALLSADAIDPL